MWVEEYLSTIFVMKIATSLKLINGSWLTIIKCVCHHFYNWIIGFFWFKCHLKNVGGSSNCGTYAIPWL
jgi:hypothetical protein